MTPTYHEDLMNMTLRLRFERHVACCRAGHLAQPDFVTEATSSLPSALHHFIAGGRRDPDDALCRF